MHAAESKEIAPTLQKGETAVTQVVATTLCRYLTDTAHYSVRPHTGPRYTASHCYVILWHCPAADNGDFTAEGCSRQDDHLPVGNWVSLAVVLSWSGGSDREHFLTIKPINIGIWCCCCSGCCCYCCKMVLLPTAAAAAARWCCCKLLLQTAAASCWCWELVVVQAAVAATSATSSLVACRWAADDLHA